MRRLWLAAGVVCAAGGLAHWAAAQNPTMPGQVVGSSFTVKPVGSAFPHAGSPVGKPVNMPADTALMRRANPFDPMDAFRGTSLDPRMVVAPTSGWDNKNALERFYEKLKSAVGLESAAPPPPPQNVTPGIFRRNRERARDRMWRRD